MPDNFIFLDKARHIPICFFNVQMCKATYGPIVVCIRNYKWKFNQRMADSYSQVMRNPALMVAVRVLHSKALIHLERCRISSASTGLWLFQSAGAPGTSEGLISTYRTCAANELVPQVSRAVSNSHCMRASFINTFFPASSNFWRNLAKSFLFFYF